MFIKLVSKAWVFGYCQLILELYFRSLSSVFNCANLNLSNKPNNDSHGFMVF